MMDAQLLKAAARGRDAIEKRAAERQRCLLVLILRFLTDAGYLEAAGRLSTDSGVSLARCDAADNISLLQVLQDWEDAHEERYGTRPKLIKQLEGGGGGSRQPSRHPSQHQHQHTQPLCPAPPISGQLAAHHRRDKAASTQAAAAAAAAPRQLPPVSRSASQTDRGSQHSSSFKQEQQVAGGTSTTGSSNSSRQQSAGAAGSALEVSGQGCEVRAKWAVAAPNSSSADGSDDEADAWAARLLKPLPTTLLGELRQLGAALSQDIFTESPNVQWSDIAGLADAKRLLQESVGLPIKYPQLFTGLLAPWRGVLLYGPPGTGKTLLAKAVATSCRTTFFNISASSIVSKWRGDSEKLVRVLFDLARHHAPATIFLDEVDALMGARGVEGEHEASRRMKTELLIQMDGLSTRSRSDSDSAAGDNSTESEPQVFVLAASNLPWDLDQALLRRLQKRILVPLPDCEARRSMLQRLLADRLAPGADLEGLVAATEGFSGCDITLLAKEAAMRPLRRLLATLEPSVGYDGGATAAEGATAATASTATGGATAAPATAATATTSLVVLQGDLAAALAVTKPSAQGHERQYAEFTSRVGSQA